MTIAAIHQVVPSLRRWDAVGDHTRRLRDVLRAAGLRSEIYSDDVDPELADEARSLRNLPPPDRARAALIYHCSIGSAIADELIHRGDPFIVSYHNLTPVGMLLRWAPDMAHLVGWGRSQVRAMAPHALLGVGDSDYNTAELIEAGYERAETAPILLAPEILEVSQADDAQGHQRDGSWLFVGRVVPNKAHHDLLAAFAWHRRHNDPDAVLHVVGSAAVPAYQRALEELADRLGISAAVRFHGSVSPEVRDRLYRRCGVFVCLSDHEGFCIPLLEAMAHRLPIVAYAAAAVPETVGSAGLVLPTKSPSLVAAAANEVLNDQVLRDELVARGVARVRAFHPDVAARRHLEVLRTVLDLAA